MNRKCLLLLLYAVLLGACDQQAQVSSSSTGQMPKREFDQARLDLGEKVFQQHCSTCHGKRARGDANWRKRKPNGMFPPPPLDGSGHAWHHSRVVLRNVIENGSKPGEGEMPAWKGRLSNREIEAVIDWFQSLWPDQVYAAWYEMQHR